jgi:hypothetical protein
MRSIGVILFFALNHTGYSQTPAIPCNNWLNSSHESYVSAGDIDIKGDKLTIEAFFNRTIPTNETDGSGFLVSKHTGPRNINYALWHNGCAISTSKGDYLIADSCPIELNKTYHVAMVYDGKKLLFYRNGFLLHQLTASGNLTNNDLTTTIGQNVPATVTFPFLGYINEVRIWKVARTQSELRSSLSAPLPGPANQKGLVAYYTFDNLLNKQGNKAWNAKASEAMLINAVNQACDFIADSCVPIKKNDLITLANSSLNFGLVAYYPFTGNADDSSGNHNNPVFNNTTLVADRFGNPVAACEFNGKDSYIRIPNSASLCPGDITLVAIVKPTGFYDGPCYNNSIIDKGAWDYKPGCYSLRFSAGEYTEGDCKDGDREHQNFVGMTADNGGSTSQDTYVIPGTWYHVVYTYGRTHSRLYINGDLISSLPSKGSFGKNSEDLFIGKKDNSQYPYWFKGIIDEIRIYKRALSGQEVFDLYQVQNPTASQ